MFNDCRLLKARQTYTLAGFTYAGLPYNVQFRLTNLQCRSHEQWAETYVLYYRKINNMAQSSTHLTPRKSFIIWEGLVIPNTSPEVAFITKDDGYSAIRCVKRWQYFDSRYMDRALKSVAQAPIIQYFQTPQPNTRLYDLCEVID